MFPHMSELLIFGLKQPAVPLYLYRRGLELELGRSVFASQARLEGPPRRGTLPVIKLPLRCHITQKRSNTLLKERGRVAARHYGTG